MMPGKPAEMILPAGHRPMKIAVTQVMMPISQGAISHIDSEE